jgi:hypothetical protein
MYAQLEFLQCAERTVIGVIDSSHLKDILGADSFAIAFALASLEIDYGQDRSRLQLAVG